MASWPAGGSRPADSARIGMLVRDPGCLFVYWEVPPSARERALEALADSGAGGAPSPAGAGLTLRVHDVSGHAEETPHGRRVWRTSGNAWDIPVHEAVSWYLHVRGHGRAYGAEIGLAAAGRFAPMARSNAVITPVGDVAQVADERWATVEELYRAAAGFQAGGPSSPDIVAGLRRQLLWHVSSPAGPWTAAGRGTPGRTGFQPEPHAPVELEGVMRP